MPGKQKKEDKEEKFSLYKMLELQKSPDVTTEHIKKQYKKLVLKYHPDKNKEDPQARQKFQKLKQAHDILTNPQKRKQYDQTGTISDIDENAFQTAYQYFRTLYKKVTVEEIEKFEKQYRGSKEQQEDLINYYNSHEGDMVELLQSIPLSRQQDIPRFIKFYTENIESQKLKLFKKFTKTKNKVRLIQNQEQEWQEEQQKQKESMNNLILAIRNKNSGKGFIEGLEEKYGLGKKKQICKKQKNIKTATNKRR